MILDKDGKTINANGRAAISADPEGKVNVCLRPSWAPDEFYKFTKHTAS